MYRQHRIAEAAKHALDLVIATFVQCDTCEMRFEYFQSRRPRHDILIRKVHAGGERVHILRCQRIFQGDEILLAYAVHGITQMARPSTVIGQQQEAAGVQVEASGDMQRARLRVINQRRDYRVTRIMRGTQNATGFVQHQVKRPASLQHGIVKRDEAEAIDKLVAFGGNNPIHANALPRQQRPYGILADLEFTSDQTIESVAVGTHRSRPASVCHRHPPLLPGAERDFRAVKVGDNFLHKYAGFVNDSTTLLATVMTHDTNSTDMAFSRLMLIDLANPDQPFYFDLTGWLEDTFPARWAAGKARGFTGTAM